MSTAKVKMSDVARNAGVSVSTVSKVLSGNGVASQLNASTIERVQQAIAKMGYVPNAVARSLRTQQTFTLASVIPDITNPFYPAFERGVQDVAEANGYDLVVYNTDGVAAKERRCLDALMRGRVDGIVGTFFHCSPEDFESILKRDIALVLLEEPGGALPEGLTADRVYVDNAKAARAAANHLVELGHTRIAMLTGQRDTLASRVRGYREALVAHGLQPLLLETGDFTEACGYSGMLELLQHETRPTAVFAANDVMAMGALLALREHQVNVPGEVALVGFDDIPVSRLLTPTLTTVSQFPERLGRRTAELLIERLRGQAVGEMGRSEEMPFELIVRESSAGPAQRPNRKLNTDETHIKGVAMI